jgi:hypothetical protein
MNIEDIDTIKITIELEKDGVQVDWDCRIDKKFIDRYKIKKDLKPHMKGAMYFRIAQQLFYHNLQRGIDKLGKLVDKNDKENHV